MLPSTKWTSGVANDFPGATITNPRAEHSIFKWLCARVQNQLKSKTTFLNFSKWTLANEEKKIDPRDARYDYCFLYILFHYHLTSIITGYGHQRYCLMGTHTHTHASHWAAVGDRHRTCRYEREKPYRHARYGYQCKPIWWTRPTAISRRLCLVPNEVNEQNTKKIGWPDNT